MTTNKRIKKETDRALEECEYKCVVCGWSSFNLKNEPLVEGAHVKPKKDLERDTFQDIIALCPNCHTEFDNNMFYISNDGKNKVFMKNGKLEVLKLYSEVKYIKKEYLAYREYQYKKNNK